MYKVLQALKNTAKLTFAGVLLCCGLSHSEAIAQNNSTESPYTRFGLGKVESPSLSFNRAIGGIGAGLRDRNMINPINPASYSAVDSMTFMMDFGVSMGQYWASSNNESNHRTLGNFDYLTMLFPVAHRLGVSIGVLPVSTSGYLFGNIQPIEGAEGQTYRKAYNGTGNLNKLYLGLAYAPFEYLSVGLNGEFYFGSFSHQRRISYSTGLALDPTFSSKLTMKAGSVNVGVQGKIPIGNKQSLTVGLAYTPKVKMHSTLYEQKFMTSGNAVVEMTSGDTISGHGLYELPHSFTAGMTYEISNKLMVGADVEYALWKDVTFADNVAQLQNMWKVSAGLQYIPNADDGSLLKKIRYRFGAHANNSYLKLPVNGGFNGYHELGVSAGLGIPLVDRRSFLQIAFEYSHLLPAVSAMPSENTIRLTLGVTFNEGWFKKLKIN
ncbi:hypothetical protein [Falsiporphyromonas endometrii]|uniref:Uncharacterized protein n=1 Tax=Falsiporphyromonas endometrii TaxID=1387297 RepID=A0ABV9K8A2_9PORP